MDSMGKYFEVHRRFHVCNKYATAMLFANDMLCKLLVIILCSLARDLATQTLQAHKFKQPSLLDLEYFHEKLLAYKLFPGLWFVLVLPQRSKSTRSNS